MIIIFLGPPFSGKGIQARLLGERLNLPVFSMGALIREARDRGNKKIAEAFEQYSMRGLHIPIEIKFPLLREKMDKSKEGFILDNFPEREDGLKTLLSYFSKNSLSVNRVFFINVPDEEVIRRRKKKERIGRPDDAPEIIKKRLKVQGRERLPVINYFRSKGVLVEINGERKENEIHYEIMKILNKNK